MFLMYIKVCGKIFQPEEMYVYDSERGLSLLHLVIQRSELTISLPCSTCPHETGKSTEQDMWEVSSDHCSASYLTLGGISANGHSELQEKLKNVMNWAYYVQLLLKKGEGTLVDSLCNNHQVCW